LAEIADVKALGPSEQLVGQETLIEIEEEVVPALQDQRRHREQMEHRLGRPRRPRQA